MADLGQLTAYIDDYDIVFQFGRKTYKIKPPARDVLDFMRNLEGFKALGRPIGQYDIWELVAPLLGAKFDRNEFRFEPCDDPDHPHHDLVPTLLTQGMDIPLLDRLLSAIHVKYMSGDEVAQEYIREGELGKALRSVRERREAEMETAETETPQGTGETTATDSETPTA